MTLERALALTPNRELTRHNPSQLQNTRYNPTGDKIMIVHRTREDFPALVEIFVYDLKTRQLRWLADDLHHPNWRPDGKAIVFVRREPLTNYQRLIEVDADTGIERVAFGADHVPAGHPSYHPTKQHLIVTDCYGGPMGNGLAIIDTKANTMRQLVTIPWAQNPTSRPTRASHSATGESGFPRGSTSTNRVRCGIKTAPKCSSPARKAAV
ncbi:MAG: hypothetical protein R2724_02370 [Bryobacterales bacterium]